jgi:HPt (histidine-containing phosphotransfer) domain-containing protein
MIAGLWSQTDKSPDPPGGPFGKGDGQVDIDPPVRGAPSREVPSRDLPSGDLPSPHSPAHEAASRDVPSESKERATTQAAVIDWSVAQVRLGGGKEILNEFSDLLKQQIPSLRADIRRAGESGDFKLLRRSAHTLKGSVSYFGAEAAMQAALAIEMLARSESLDGFPGLLTALETELTQVLAVLEAGPPESIS